VKKCARPPCPHGPDAVMATRQMMVGTRDLRLPRQARRCPQAPEKKHRPGDSRSDADRTVYTTSTKYGIVERDGVSECRLVEAPFGDHVFHSSRQMSRRFLAGPARPLRLWKIVLGTRGDAPLGRAGSARGRESWCCSPCSSPCQNCTHRAQGKRPMQAARTPQCSRQRPGDAGDP